MTTAAEGQRSQHGLLTAMAVAAVVLAGCSGSAGESSSPAPAASIAPPAAGVTPLASPTSWPPLVAWIDATPTPLPSPTTMAVPPGTAVCSAAGLAATVGWQGATGNMVGWIAVTNTSSHACSISGPPRLVSLEGSSGTPIDISYRANPAPDAGVGTVAGPALVLPGGQAASFLWWSNECEPARPSVARVIVTLAGGSGSLRAAPLGPGIFGVPRCDVPGAPSVLTAYAFTPVPAVTTPPEPQPAYVVVSAPPTAAIGQDLDFVVELTNVGTAPAQLDPCPSYTEDLLIGGVALKPPVARTYLLDCAAVGPSIEPSPGPGSTIRLAMRLAIPDFVLPGPAELRWSLDPGGPFDSASASGGTSITLLRQP